MDFYRNEKKDDRDTYYQDEARRAIDTAVTAAQAAGKSGEELRFEIRRSYPFGALRNGRPYKIWNTMVLKKERDLGLPTRKHKRKGE